MVKESMNDPDFHDHDRTTYRDDGETIFIRMRYRGKNAFRGAVRGRVTTRADIDGTVLEILSQQ